MTLARRMAALAPAARRVQVPRTRRPPPTPRMAMTTRATRVGIGSPAVLAMKAAVPRGVATNRAR